LTNILYYFQFKYKIFNTSIFTNKYSTIQILSLIHKFINSTLKIQLTQYPETIRTS
jgi:hypothetical protein